MKNITKLIIALMALTLLSGCSALNIGGQIKDNITGVKMIAEVKAVGETLEVEVIEGEYGASGTYWVITSSSTVIKDQDGNRVSTLKVGDKIEITYGGQVMMSYPPQIVAKKIIVLK